MKSFVAALALSSVAAFAGLGLFPTSASAAAPQSELTRLDQQLGLHAKKHHKKHHHKKGTTLCRRAASITTKRAARRKPLSRSAR